MTYVCSRCFEEKKIEEFHKSSVNKRGHITACKHCEFIRYKKRKEKDPEAHNLKSTLWHRKKKEENPNKGKEYYQKNKERITEYKKKNKDKYRDRINARTRLNLYVLRGYITKPDICSVCFIKCEKIEAHHEDYSDALNVKWLCSKCHVMADKEKKNKDLMKKYELLRDSNECAILSRI